MDGAPDSPGAASTTSSFFEEAQRRILMPVDPSEHSMRAFTWYTEHLHRPGDAISLVHVVEPVTTGMSKSLATKSLSMNEDVSRMFQDQIEDGKALGQKFIDICRSKEVKNKFTLHIGSKPGEHIIRLAKEQNIDIVVMGNRGVGTLHRTFLGSVSDYILHNVNIPVVVVPPPKTGKPEKEKSKKEEKASKAKLEKKVSKDV